MSDPTLIIRKNPLELSPAERLKLAQEILRKESREDWRKLIPKLIDPDAKQVAGRVTVADREGVEQVPWRHSATAPGQFGTELRQHVVQAPRDLWEQMRKPPRRRDPLERVDSMVRRYVAEWKAGNGALLEKLGREICGQYWLAGMPLSVDKLRQLATASLEDAERRRKAEFSKRSTKPWDIR